MKVPRLAGKKVRIEMLPLIDVVFLLLVVFIYTMLAMVVHRGIPVVLPDSDTAEVSKESLLSVTVRRDGVLFLDKQQTDLAQLTSLLRQRIVENNARLLLFVDKEVIYQKLYQVMDHIKLAGIEDISLQAASGSE